MCKKKIYFITIFTILMVKILLFLLGFVPNKHVHIRVVAMICWPGNLCDITVLSKYVATHFTCIKKLMLL